MTWLTEPMIGVVAFPVLAGLVCALLWPKCFDQLRAWITVAASLITAVLAWQIFASMLSPEAAARILPLGLANLTLRLDHLSSFVVLAVAVFGFLIALFSLGYMKGKERLDEYCAYLLWTVGLSCGAALANDLILLLIFWGLLALTLYVMIGLGGPDASSAAKKSFIVVGGADCFLLLGVAIVWLLAGTRRMDEISLALNGRLSYVAFLCFAAAAFAKAGAMPLHSWVPDCGEKAPASVTAFLPASLDKLLGIYLLARVVTSLFIMTPGMNALLMLVGAGTVVCAVMMALVQHDLKRLLSYHAVSQVGYMVLGIGTGVPLGIAGGLFHMLNHAIYKSALFLCAGAVEQKAGTTDLDRLGGLARAMPLTFGACFVAAMAISGVPPLNGFTSKWMVYQGIVESSSKGGSLWIVWLTAAMFGSALTLASFVKVLHGVFLSKPTANLAGKSIREVGVSMWAPMVVLAALCVLFGVLAFRLPLRTMIFPAVGGTVPFLGAWRGGLSAALLLLAGLFGGGVYLLTTVRKSRRCETYIGGELMGETYVQGVGKGPGRDVEVTGVDFYRSVEEMPPLRGIYRAARQGVFDAYEVGTRTVFYFVEMLRRAHSGLLPAYLTWLLVGLLALLWMLVYGPRLI